MQAVYLINLIRLAQIKGERISELDIIVDSNANDVSVQESLRDQILSKATVKEEVGNV